MLVSEQSWCQFTTLFGHRSFGRISQCLPKPNTGSEICVCTKTLGLLFSMTKLEAYDTYGNVWFFDKNIFVVCSMKSAALAIRSFGVMQKSALTGCIIFKYLNTTKRLFAFG